MSPVRQSQAVHGSGHDNLARGDNSPDDHLIKDGSPADDVLKDDSPERDASGGDSPVTPVTPMCVPMHASGDTGASNDDGPLSLPGPALERASWHSDVAAELRGRGFKVYVPRTAPPTQVSTGYRDSIPNIKI